MTQFFIAILFLASVSWVAKQITNKTGLRFRYSLSCAWWLAIIILAILFNAFK
jgi:hypothetical protein